MGLILIDGKMKQALKGLYISQKTTYIDSICLEIALNNFGGLCHSLFLILLVPHHLAPLWILELTAMLILGGQMKSKLGLNFMGMVKTAHKRFPKKFLNEWYKAGWDPNPRRPIGSWKLLRSTYELDNQEYPMYALGWHDLKPKTIFCNVGTSIRA